MDSPRCRSHLIGQDPCGCPTNLLNDYPQSGDKDAKSVTAQQPRVQSTPRVDGCGAIRRTSDGERLVVLLVHRAREWQSSFSIGSCQPSESGR